MGVDVCIRGGTVIDGTGSPARIADVGIVGDRVVAVEPRLDESASTVIEADGRVVCPGFVDLATHNDFAGQPVPSRFADDAELLALCAEVGRHPGTTLEFIPGVGQFTDREAELMGRMSAAADRPLNWNVLIVMAGLEAQAHEQL